MVNVPTKCIESTAFFLYSTVVRRKKTFSTKTRCRGSVHGSSSQGDSLHVFGITKRHTPTAFKGLSAIVSQFTVNLNPNFRLCCEFQMRESTALWEQTTCLLYLNQYSPQYGYNYSLLLQPQPVPVLYQVFPSRNTHNGQQLRHTMELWMKRIPFHLLLSWWPTTPSWPGSPSWEWSSPSSVCSCASSPSGSSVKFRAPEPPSIRTCAAASSWPNSSSWWGSTCTRIRWGPDIR